MQNEPLSEINEKFIDKHLSLFDDRVFIRNSKGNFEKVEIADILWIEADRAYSVVTTSEKEYTISKNLTAFMKSVQHPSLMRVHRSYIVNISKIYSIKNRELIVLKYEKAVEDSQIADNGNAVKNHITKEIPLGKLYKCSVFKAINCI